MKFLTVALVMLTATTLLTGCYDHWHRIEGNGNIMTETRQLPEFNRVFNEGSFDVYIIQDGKSEVIIEAESNLIPAIRTQVKGSSLEIDTRDNLHNNYPIKVYVHTTDIYEVKLSGSGLIEAANITTGNYDVGISGSGYIYFSGTAEDVRCDISGSGAAEIDLTADELDVNISGSGEVQIFGTIRRGDFDISGSGSIRAYELLQQECYARISGSGDMFVTVEDYLDVNISGSGSIYYMGSPSINSKITGSGSIIHP